MQTRRKTRLGIALAVLVGLGLTIGLTLYALSANIDLFYTPGEILYGKTETHQRPHHGQRLRIGGFTDDQHIFGHGSISRGDSRCQRNGQQQRAKTGKRGATHIHGMTPSV